MTVQVSELYSIESLVLNSQTCNHFFVCKQMINIE